MAEAYIWWLDEYNLEETAKAKQWEQTSVKGTKYIKAQTVQYI